MHPSNVLERRAKALAADLRVLAAHDFLKLDLPPREPVLGPMLVRGSVTLLRGPAGIGKSWLALSLAHAAAGGVPVLGWSAPRAARVLYVDAQMPLTLLQARLGAIAGFGGGEGALVADPSRRDFASGEIAPQDEVVREGKRPHNRRTKKSPHPEEARRAVSKPHPEEPRRGVSKDESHTCTTPNLHLLAAEAQVWPLPDLGAESGRAALMRVLCPETEAPGAAPAPAFDLLVLDGLSALLRSARGRNDPAREFAEFLSGLRRAGLCVLLVDRARTRKRMAPPFEDMLDAVIDVRRPAGLGESAGPHMAVAIAGRGLGGAEAFEARLVVAAGAGDGEEPGWRRVARLDAAVLEAWRLERQGWSYRAIARALGVSVATAWRLAQKAHALDPAVLEAAAAECDGDLALAGETGRTDETGETPETAGAAAAPEAEDEAALPSWQRKLRRLERAVWLEQAAGPAPQQAAKLWARVIAGARLPPGVLFSGREWQAVDRALHAHIGAGLEAAGEGAGAAMPTPRAPPPPGAPSPRTPGSSASPAPAPVSACRGPGPPAP
jgi:transcriptional regulator with XRE-family HTH domain